MQGHVADLCRGLVEAGHEVEVVAPKHPDGLESTSHLGGTWHFGSVPSRKPGRPTRNRDWLSESAGIFERLHKANPFDVVHSESTSGLGLLRRGVHRQVPFVAKFHGNYLGLAKETIGRAVRDSGVEPRVREAKHLVWITAQHFVPPDIFRFRACEAMVPSRQQVPGTARSYLLDRARVHVVPNGIDAEEFKPRSREEAREALDLGPGKLLVCVGRLERDKGYETAIEALGRLGDPEPRLLVIGSGPEQELLEATARRAGVADRIVFLGRRPRTEVADYLAAADAFLFPTERDEAAPLVPLEAMASGLAVLTTSVGGGAELIEDGVSGLLLPPANADAWAEAIRSLLADETLRRRMGQAARERILSGYTIDAMIRQTLDVYELAAARLKDG